MNEHMSPEAACMLERAKYFAQFFGNQMIAPEDMLAGYMLTEAPHRMLHARLTRRAVFNDIFAVYPRGNDMKGIDAVTLPLSLDSECRAIIAIAVEASIESGRPIEARDLMAAILKHHSSQAVGIIIAVTQKNPDELLKDLLQQLA